MNPPGRQGADRIWKREVAFPIRLRQAEDRDIEPAAIVEVELIGLVDHGLRIRGGAEIESPRRNPAKYAGLRGERHEVQDLFFVGDVRHALGHSDPEVHHCIGTQFHRRAPGNDLARVHVHRPDGVGRDPDLGRVRGAVAVPNVCR